MSASENNDSNPLTRSQAKRLWEHGKDSSDGECSECSSDQEDNSPLSTNSHVKSNKDISKLYILIDSLTINKIIKGTDADWQKFIKDLNFLLLTEYFQWSKDSAVVIEANFLEWK